MHKEIINKEKRILNHEMKDVDYLKSRSPKKYEEAEHYLDGQDKTISKVSKAIHHLRGH